MQNVRYALRTLKKSTVLSTTVIFTLALGMGANTAVFSVFSADLLHFVPYPNSDRLVVVKAVLSRRSLARVYCSQF